MSIPVHCARCGYRGISRNFSITNSTGITFSGGGERCPACGGTAAYVSGTYDFVGDTIAAFTAPGVTRQKIEAFRDLAGQVAQNAISPEDAARQAEKIESSFGWLILSAAARGITFDRLLAVVLAFLAFWEAFAPDADVQALVAASQQQNELSKKMLQELQRQSATSGTSTPKVQKPSRPPAQTQAPRNRAERRKAAAIARRSRDTP